MAQAGSDVDLAYNAGAYTCWYIDTHVSLHALMYSYGCIHAASAVTYTCIVPRTASVRSQLTKTRGMCVLLAKSLLHACDERNNTF